jgi:hypothetical protein
VAVVRLRALSEAEAYARCYGEGDESVLSVKIEPRRSRLFHGVSGEDLRLAFETRLQSRESAHEAIAEVLGEAVPGSVPGGASNGHKPAAAA